MNLKFPFLIICDFEVHFTRQFGRFTDYLIGQFFIISNIICNFGELLFETKKLYI